MNLRGFSPEGVRAATIDGVRRLFSLIWSAAYRFYWDDCFSRAAALAYTTLFALVPVTALSFSMFGVFGFEGEETAFALRRILEQVLPIMANDQVATLQSQVFTSLENFTANMRALNTLSIAALVFTSVALLNTIESALNVVWRTTSNLGIISKITSFWAVLTLGPLLIALSIFWTTKVQTLGLSDELSSVYVFLVSYVFPTAVSTLGLTLLFYKLPAARVRVIDAFLGAVIAAVLFEVIKRTFAYYIGLSANYSAVYGVVASIPLFLFWLYVTWMVVLYGAEVSYQSNTAHILSGLRRYATELGEVGALLGLRMLLTITRRFLRGETPPTESEIAIDCGSDPVLVRTCLNTLSDANIVSPADEQSHTRNLLIAPDRILVAEVLETFRSEEYRKRIRLGLEQTARNELLESFRILGRDHPERDSTSITLLELAQLSTHRALPDVGMQ